MGWWTLGGHHSQPVVERVKAEFSGNVLRIEGAGFGDRTYHAIVRGADGVTRWGVALVENGMVKVMGEEMGPYCRACSPDFYAAAVEACGEAEPDSFAGAFRERMRAVHAEAVTGQPA